MESRQQIHAKAGAIDPDFNSLDVEGSRCAEINQLALDYASQKLNAKQSSRYSQYGNKLAVGADLGP